jgi:hypothetical protein
MNLTTTRQQRQQQRLERVWQQVAVQIPTARPQVPWPVLLGAGVVIGLGLGWAAGRADGRLRRLGLAGWADGWWADGRLRRLGLDGCWAG